MSCIFLRPCVVVVQSSSIFLSQIYRTTWASTAVHFSCHLYCTMFLVHTSLTTFHSSDIVKSSPQVLPPNPRSSLVEQAISEAGSRSEKHVRQLTGGFPKHRYNPDCFSSHLKKFLLVYSNTFFPHPEILTPTTFLAEIIVFLHPRELVRISTFSQRAVQHKCVPEKGGYPHFRIYPLISPSFSTHRCSRF